MISIIVTFESLAFVSVLYYIIASGSATPSFKVFRILWVITPLRARPAFIA